MPVSSLEEAIHAVARQIGSPRACCVIAHEGTPDESTLMGTRDGYLNLALALLRFVADADVGRCEVGECGYIWDDRIKAALYQLPNGAAWLVGSCLFGSHAEYMKELSRWVNPQLEHPLLNDPAFAEPNSVGAAGPVEPA